MQALILKLQTRRQYTWTPIIHRISRTARTSYPFSTIQRGIDVATYQDIVIVKPGTYNENIAFGEQNFTLTSIDPNDPCIVASTVIDSNGANGAVVTFNNNCSVLTGFTITNGDNFGFGFGGGIFCNGQCEDASPTISHCIITRNSAVVAGGGIYCYNNSPTIYNCIITGNLTDGGQGGGIVCQNDYAWYYPIISQCLVAGNTSSSGGGIYLGGGTPTVSHCDISSNYSESGGGIFCGSDVNLLVSHSILWADTAVNYGPEIFVMISGNSSVVTIEYSDVQGGLAGISYPPGHTAALGRK